MYNDKPKLAKISKSFKIHQVMMMMIACLNMAFAKDLHQV